MAGSDYNYEDLADTPEWELDYYLPEVNFTNGSESESYCGPHSTKEDFEFLECMSLVIKGYGNIVLAVFGIIANILAICIFSKKSFKSNFNNLLIALAVCDLLFLVLSIAESTRSTFQEHTSNSSSVAGQVTFLHHLLFPYFLYPLHNILLSASIFMTVSISIERYLAIFHPLVYRNRQGIHYSLNLGCCVQRARVIKQQLSKQ